MHWLEKKQLMIYNKNVEENSSVKRAQMAGVEMLYIYGRVLLPKRLDCLRNFYNVSSIPNTKTKIIKHHPIQNHANPFVRLMQKVNELFCKTDVCESPYQFWHQIYCFLGTTCLACCVISLQPSNVNRLCDMVSWNHGTSWHGIEINPILASNVPKLIRYYGMKPSTKNKAQRWRMHKKSNHINFRNIKYQWKYPGLLPMGKAAHSVPALANKEGSPHEPTRTAAPIWDVGRAKTAWIRYFKNFSNKSNYIARIITSKEYCTYLYIYVFKHRHKFLLWREYQTRKILGSKKGHRCYTLLVTQFLKQSWVDQDKRVWPCHDPKSWAVVSRLVPLVLDRNVSFQLQSKMEVL